MGGHTSRPPSNDDIDQCHFHDATKFSKSLIFSSNPLIELCSLYAIQKWLMLSSGCDHTLPSHYSSVHLSADSIYNQIWTSLHPPSDGLGVSSADKRRCCRKWVVHDRSKLNLLPHSGDNRSKSTGLPNQSYQILLIYSIRCFCSQHVDAWIRLVEYGWLRIIGVDRTAADVIIWWSTTSFTKWYSGFCSISWWWPWLLG